METKNNSSPQVFFGVLNIDPVKKSDKNDYAPWILSLRESTTKWKNCHVYYAKDGSFNEINAPSLQEQDGYLPHLYVWKSQGTFYLKSIAPNVIRKAINEVKTDSSTQYTVGKLKLLDKPEEFKLLGEFSSDTNNNNNRKKVLEAMKEALCKAGWKE